VKYKQALQMDTADPEAIDKLLSKVTSGKPILTAGKYHEDIPTIHDVAGKYHNTVDHMGFGMFQGHTPHGKFTFDGGGAMYHTGNVSWCLLGVENPAVLRDLKYSLPKVKAALKELAKGTGKTANQIAQTILDQMGGQRRLSVMIGATNFVSHPRGVSFSFPRPGSRKPNYLKITLEPSDTYTLEFGSRHGYNYKKLKTFDDIYAEQLGEIFSRTTGLHLRLAGDSMNASANPLQDAMALAADIQRLGDSQLKPADIKAAVEKYLRKMDVSVKMKDLLEDILYSAVKTEVDAHKIITLTKQHTIPKSGKSASRLLTAGDYERMLEETS